jgi:hypothetical protein
MEYRLVILGSSGEPASFEDWACASDQEAMERASRHGSSFGRELWKGQQRLSSFAGAIAPRAEAKASAGASA